MIKYHDGGNLEKEGFIWAHGSRGIGNHHGREQQEQHISCRKLETKTDNWKLYMAFETSKPAPSDILLPEG